MASTLDKIFEVCSPKFMEAEWRPEIYVTDEQRENFIERCRIAEVKYSADGPREASRAILHKVGNEGSLPVKQMLDELLEMFLGAGALILLVAIVALTVLSLIGGFQRLNASKYFSGSWDLLSSLVISVLGVFTVGEQLIQAIENGVLVKTDFMNGILLVFAAYQIFALFFLVLVTYPFCCGIMKFLLVALFGSDEGGLFRNLRSHSKATVEVKNDAKEALVALEESGKP